MESWGLLYYGSGIFFRDPAWRLSEEEAADLTGRTMELVKSIDPEALKKFEKKYGKYVPALSLVYGVGTITYGRVVHTAQLRKAERAESIQGKSRSRGPDPRAPETSASTNAHESPERDGSGDEDGRGPAPAQGGETIAKAPGTIRTRGSTDWTDLVGGNDA